MKKIILFITSLFVYCFTLCSSDVKYATSSELEKMQQQAISSLTPLMEAIIEKDIPKINSLIEQDKQAQQRWATKDILRINAQDKTGQTALMWAIVQELPLDIVKLLLGVKNINVSIKDNQDLSALDYAVMSGNDQIVQTMLTILQKWIKPTLVNQYDKKSKLTSLARATIRNNSKIIQLLLHAGANPTAEVTRNNKRIPVFELYKAADNQVSALLKNKTKDYTERGLNIFKAIEKSQTNEARKLIELGINFNVKDKDSYTPIHRAAMTNNKNILQLLIANKADVDVCDNNGNTPLHYAADRALKDIYTLLIGNKADVNAKNSEKYTPLHYSASQGHINMVTLLINDKADVNAQDEDGFTPVHYAFAHLDVVNLLVDKKANIKSDSL